MIQPTAKRTQPLEALNPKVTAQQAVDYFSSHPELLLDHPSLLAELILPFSSNPASLVERQIQILRKQNAHFQLALQKNAAQIETNAVNLQRVSTLLEHIVSTHSLQDSLNHLNSGLTDIFGFEHIHLCVFGTPMPKFLEIDQCSTFIRQYPQDHIHGSVPDISIRLGPLRDTEKNIFFHKPERVQSAAIIPLATKEIKIVLCIGHTHALFFKSESDFTYLNLLQKTLMGMIKKSE